MNPAQAYQRPAASLPRVDLILTLYDGVLNLLDQAAPLLHNQPEESRRLLHRAQLILGAMGAGINSTADELSVRFMALYEFVIHRLSAGTEEGIRDARGILVTLRDAFRHVREHAVEMERRGEIPPMQPSARLQAIA